jgi:hypothetical protein
VLFECGQSQLKLVDTVPENLQLGFLGEPSLCSTPQSRRHFGPRGDKRERY